MLNHVLVHFEENLMVFKKMSTKSEKLLVRSACTRSLGGVYMTPGQLLRQAEFTLVPSHGSGFVYVIPPENVMSHRHEITPGVEPLREFHSGTKFCNSIM